MTLTIKFSKTYMKLPANANGKTALLLHAVPIELGLQLGWLLDYDTTATDGSKYPLPATGKHILLLFICEGSIFTTIRRYTTEKYLYYNENTGKDFKIEINEGGN